MIAVPMAIDKANAFVREHHRHSKPVAVARFAIGAWADDALVGVSIVGNPVARALQDGLTAEVRRCCVSPGAPKGACSFLYSRCWRIWRLMGGCRLVTYTLASESGASLRGAGFRVVAQLPARHWDMPGRRRDWQPVYSQPKQRWELP